VFTPPQNVFFPDVMAINRKASFKKSRPANLWKTPE